MRLVQTKTSGLTTLWGENVISRKNRATDCILTRSLDAIRRPGLHKYQKRLTSQDSVCI